MLQQFILQQYHIWRFSKAVNGGAERLLHECLETFATTVGKAGECAQVLSNRERREAASMFLSEYYLEIQVMQDWCIRQILLRGAVDEDG